MVQPSLSTIVTLASVVLLSCFSQTQALNPVKIKGTKFFDETTGAYLPIKGINYYPRPNDGKYDLNNLDFFTDEFKHIWQRDLPQMQYMGANTIRLYAVDPTKNHDSFMCALESLGMYAIIGLASSCDGCEITTDEAPACYPSSFKQRGEAIIKAFSKYENTLAFSGGNEVNHRVPVGKPEWNAPCQKKFIRDMRAFIKKCPSMRQIPVGVVTADTDREIVAKYYNCRSDSSDELENVEWYGLNTYVHCDGTQEDDPEKADGFVNLRKDFADYKYSIPVVLTEFGCLNPSFPTVGDYEAQRDFNQAGWIFTSSYDDYFAGGVVFEYSTELANSKSTSDFPFTSFGAQNYGLGYLSPVDCNEDDVKCEYIRMPNAENLKTKFEAVDTSSAPSMNDYTPDSERVSPNTCPSEFPALSTFTWLSDSTESAECPTEETMTCSESDALPTIDDDSSNSGATTDGSDSRSKFVSLMVPLSVILFTILF